MKVDYSALTFGQIVRLAKQEASMSTHNLSKALDIDQKLINDIEGDKYASISIVDKIVKYFQLDRTTMARLNMYNHKIWKDYYKYINE